MASKFSKGIELSMHRIAITLGVFLVCSVGVANAQPALSDEAWQFPRATEVEFTAQCGASIAFRLGWRTEGRQVRYETFELSVGGRPALTAEQADRAIEALNLLYERRRMHFSSPAVRCDLNRPVGTLMIYQSPDRLAQGSISLKVSSTVARRLAFWSKSVAQRQSTLSTSQIADGVGATNRSTRLRWAWSAKSQLTMDGYQQQ